MFLQKCFGTLRKKSRIKLTPKGSLRKRANDKINKKNGRKKMG